MRRRRMVTNVSGAAGVSMLGLLVLHALFFHGTMYVGQKVWADRRERDPAGAVWYAGQLTAGSHLALPSVPYRGTLAAHLAAMSPVARTAWWDAALDLADDTNAFVAEQKRLSAARDAAGKRGPDPYRTTAAPGPTLLTMSVVWEAAANMAESVDQRERATRRWQAMADARHVDAMRWWKDWAASPDHARENPPPPPVMPRWNGGSN